MTSGDGVFTPQLNTFVKLLTERLGEKFAEDFGKMADYTRTRIEMSILRAAYMCVRGIRIGFKY